LWISYGCSEVENDRYYITQIFTGPGGFAYKYRKTWLSRDTNDVGFRNEHARFDPGTGPVIFDFNGTRSTCFICADGEAPRCVERAAILQPELVFYPNNRQTLPDFEVFGERARKIGAPMLVTNRIGKSWNFDCQGGCAAFDKKGQVIAAANRQGREELLLVDLPQLS
jgi:predicted amidohydrolase